MDPQPQPQHPASVLVRELMEGPNAPVSLPNNLNTVVAQPMPHVKEWHASVTLEHRNHLVHKLLQAIYPSPNQQTMPDRRMQNLVDYVKKVEGDIYSLSNSRVSTLL